MCGMGLSWIYRSVVVRSVQWSKGAGETHIRWPLNPQVRLETDQDPL